MAILEVRTQVIRCDRCGVEQVVERKAEPLTATMLPAGWGHARLNVMHSCAVNDATREADLCPTHLREAYEALGPLVKVSTDTDRPLVPRTVGELCNWALGLTPTRDALAIVRALTQLGWRTKKGFLGETVVDLVGYTPSDVHAAWAALETLWELKKE